MSRKFKKIIYFNYQPVNSSIIKNFYLNELKINTIEYEYWDLTNLFFSFKLENNNSNLSFVYYFEGYKQIINRLKEINISETLFVSMITYDGKTINLFRILTKFNCTLSIFARGMLPSISTTTELNLNKYKKIFNKQKLKNFILNKLALFLKKIKLIKTYDIIFQAGELGYNTIGVGANLDILKCIKIDINYFDYDSFIEQEKFISKSITEKYIVFLDEFLPFHPDFKILNVKTIDPKKYYSSLNNFFDQIEAKFKLKIIVCGHPKSKGIDNNFFDNRLVIYDNTAEIVKYSEFVLAHCSSSISFAVLYNKPVISLITNEIVNEMHDYYNFIKSFSNEIQSNIINIDNKIKDIIIKLNYEENYKKYKIKYLTSIKNPTLTTKEIFFNFLNFNNC